MPKKIELTSEQIQSISLHYAQGLSFEEVARAVGGMSAIVVRRYLNSAGESRPRSSSSNTKKTQFAPEIVRRYESGEAVSAIATALGLSDTCVANAIKRANIPLRTLSQQRALKPKVATVSSRIARNMRTRIWYAVKGVRHESTKKLIGCSWTELTQHLQSKFSDGMNFDNYGLWEVDHITPLASFDLSDAEQLRVACHYSNLQPLWRQDNRKKSSSTTGKTQVYVVAGQSGAGKTTLCNQLKPTVTCAWDTLRGQIVETVAATLQQNPLVLVDVPIRSRQMVKLLRSSGCVVKYVVLLESPQTVTQRLQSRGSTRLKNVDRMHAKYARYAQTADFSGNYDECLSWLRQELGLV